MGGPGSGGARTRSGPVRDRGAIRRGRNGDSGLTDLPISGREGDAPTWPLGRPAKFERETWEREWRRPQAIMWEKLGWEVQVALYVRTMRQATSAKASAGSTTNLLRQMVNLGLTEDGMARNRWRIVDEPAAATAPRRAPSTSAKDRLKVIGGTDARSA
jgi:hypothetical protein